MQPVFFVGFPRSGTTLLQKVLDSHNNISVIEENNPLADKGDKLYNFMTKKVLNEKAKKSILEIPEMGDKAKKAFVEQRLNGDLNLWSPMKKTPLINWDDLCKIVKLK